MQVMLFGINRKRIETTIIHLTYSCKYAMNGVSRLLRWNANSGEVGWLNNKVVQWLLG